MLWIPRSWGDVENNKNEKEGESEREIGNRQPSSIQLSRFTHCVFFLKLGSLNKSVMHTFQIFIWQVSLVSNLFMKSLFATFLSVRRSKQTIVVIVQVQYVYAYGQEFMANHIITSFIAKHHLHSLKKNMLYAKGSIYNHVFWKTLFWYLEPLY